MSVIINPSTGGGGSGITQLTGDVTAGPGSGSQASTLATVNATTGTFGDATHVGQFTVNGKGLITSAANVAISGGGGMAIGGAVTGGTSGSVLFIDGSTNLAQDNTNFFWDDTNFALKLGHLSGTAALYLNTLPAIYSVPNASGANWFEGNAGNFTVTGTRNFGTGDFCLLGITTGSDNTGLGAQALQLCSSGDQNTAIGTLAMQTLTTGTRNFALGDRAMKNAGTNVDMLAIGSNALQANTAGVSIVAIGTSALGNLNNPGLDQDNVAIGAYVSQSQTSGGQNVLIGRATTQTLTSADCNTMIGSRAGASLTGSNCSFNTWIGPYVGPSATVTNSIVLTNGFTAINNNIAGVDYNFTTSHVWAFQDNTSHIGLHVYNTTDSAEPPTNYERGCLDWNLTSNIFRLASQAGGTGVTRLIAIDGFSKAGAPANTDLPSGTFALIDDTTNNQTWLVFNKGGTIRKVQLT